MIDQLQPYPAYRRVETRDRNIPWLTSVPHHWSTLPSKRLFSTRNERARPEDEQLSATQAYGVIPQREFERRVGRRVVQILQHLDKRRHVERDDFVISMRSFQGGLERAWSPGAIRSSYVVLRSSAAVDVRYFAHLFKCRDYISALQQTSNFIRDGQDLNFGNFCLVDLPVVPLREQTLIARFIDYADSRIRRHVRAKQKLIQLLEEQRQAIIDQVVTSGVASGTGRRRLVASVGRRIPWLSQVPTHWELLPAKALFVPRTELARLSDTQLSATQAYGVIAQADYERRIGRRVVKINLHLEKRRHVERDDFVISMRSFQGGLERAWVSGCIRSSYVVLRALRPVDFGYFAYLLKSRRYVQALQATANFIRDGQDLNYENFSMVDLPLPPPTEQSEIAQHLDRVLAETNLAASKAEAEIQLLAEYRTRMVSDVVTGKIDVRQAAAALPDEVSNNEHGIDEVEDPDDETESVDEEADE